MDSNFFLRIKDPKINEAFILSRTKAMSWLSLLTLLTRIISLAFSLISQLAGFQYFIFEYWLVRAIGLLWHFLSILLCWKYPLTLRKYESFSLMPSFMMNFIFFWFEPDNPTFMVITIMAIGMYFLMAVLLNNNWLITSTGILFASVGTIAFLMARGRMYDLTYGGVIGSFAGITIYSCYFFEKQMKLQFIQMEKIRSMNRELQIILDNLPEGIVFWDTQRDQVGLCNKEFRRLF